jgi:hypothetical protein
MKLDLMNHSINYSVCNDATNVSNNWNFEANVQISHLGFGCIVSNYSIQFFVRFFFSDSFLLNPKRFP